MAQKSHRRHLVAVLCFTFFLALTGTALAVDNDMDGQQAPPNGFDCADNDASIYTGAPDPLNDGIDQNCDGSNEQDADRDSYSQPTGGNDCDDFNASVHPGATEIPDNGIDEDCSGADLSADTILLAPPSIHSGTGIRAAAFKQCRKHRKGRPPHRRHGCKAKALKLPV